MSVRSKIIGTWECLYWKSINANNENDVIHPYTEQIKGNIVYSSDGYMAAILQRPGVPNYTPGPLQGTPEEYQKAAANTNGYHGPYYLEESSDGEIKLFHHIMIGLPTNWTGETQVRLCKMWEESGRLYMKLGPKFNYTDPNGIERRIELLWRKREPNTLTMPP